MMWMTRSEFDRESCFYAVGGVRGSLEWEDFCSMKLPVPTIDKQKDDLQNQVAFLRQFCNAKGIIIDQCIEDYGSGLNYNRKKWNELLNEVMEQKIKTIIVTHKDRFIRFGYDWFEKFCMKFNTSIVVVNNEELSPQEELVQDIVSILHVFSCRLYGLRKYKKQIERDEEIAKELQDGNQSDSRAKNQD